MNDKIKMEDTLDLERLRTDFAYFAEHVLGMKPYTYQIETLNALNNLTPEERRIRLLSTQQRSRY